MINDIPVTCLMNRAWNPITKVYEGVQRTGVLIKITSESFEADFSKIIPVGIVIFDDNSFKSVPIEFITKN